MKNKDVWIHFGQINKLVDTLKIKWQKISLVWQIACLFWQRICPSRQMVCNNVDKQTGCLILYGGGGVCESRTPGKEKKIVKIKDYT